MKIYTIITTYHKDIIHIKMFNTSKDTISYMYEFFKKEKLFGRPHKDETPLQYHRRYYKHNLLNPESAMQLYLEIKEFK